jgi:N-acetylneuraminate synthase
MVKIIAEIGINHNGNIELCKKMMYLSKLAGVDYVKIQKRTPSLCVPEDQKNKSKDTPWGTMTYLEYKERLEFNEEQIAELFRYAKEIDVEFFASVWDIPSADLMAKYTTMGKIPSALINDLELCAYARSKFPLFMISTGMSSEEQIEKCVAVCDPDIIMHTNSCYPADYNQLNLQYITWLKNKYPGKQIYYSGHELGLVTTFAAVGLGIDGLERHVCLSHQDWGSDQESSIEIVPGVFKLVKGVRDIEKAMQYLPGPRILFEKELKKMETLRPNVVKKEC